LDEQVVMLPKRDFPLYRSMRRVVPYSVTLLVFIAMDAVWLTLTTALYRDQLGDLLAPQVRWVPGVLFYLIQVMGIQIFVLPRAGKPVSAFGFGAAFGFFTYATYDLTNWAVMKDWTFSISAMDISWGAVVTGAASLAGYLAARRFVK
jgi:uncharacterized membrane protein